MLPELDISGQEKLLEARVLVVGLGGLGSPAAIYLAAAGVGHLTLVDHDTVDLSNLQRQIAHGECNVGQSKVDSAIESLARLNSTITIEPIAHQLEGDNLTAAVESADVVLDATDNFISRFAINQACVATHTPLVSGAAIRLEGQIAVFDSRVDDSPCYRCLYNEANDEMLNCAENGVVAPLVGIIGTIQAMEAIKLIAGFGDVLVGHVLYIDVKRMDWRKLKLPRNPNCPTCGQKS
jgi:molybdopterin/thiamine biosynthesis adenylyltransferase